MKHYLLSLLVLLAIVIPVAGTFITPGQALAAASCPSGRSSTSGVNGTPNPSVDPDSGTQIGICLVNSSGTALSGSGYTVSFNYTNGAGTGTKIPNADASYVSSQNYFLTGIMATTGSQCSGKVPHEPFNASVTKGGKTYGSYSIDLCTEPRSYTAFEKVTVSQSTVQEGYIKGTITYEGGDGSQLPFSGVGPNRAAGTITDSSTGKKYNVSFDDNGNIVLPTVLPVGSYTFTTGSWLTPATANSTSIGMVDYTKSFTVTTANTSSNPVDLSGTVKNGESGSEPAPSGPDDNTTPTCAYYSGTFSFSWALCPLVNGLAKAADGVYTTLIGPFLVTKPMVLNSSDPTFVTWENFRVYGDVILVILLLVVVFGESIGGGLIDAYSAKKILPRLLAAAVLINLSIYIVTIGVDITNILGGGIINLIEEPFKSAGQFQIKINGSTGDIGTLGIFAAVTLIWKAHIAAELAEMVLLFTLIPALLILLAILITIILRRGLILLLIISAPIAFALYCLPNTEKYFRRWWDLLMRTLIVYPLIAAMFALANVLSVTIDSSSTGATKTAADFVSLFTLFVPLMLIPFSFRLAGGLLGRFHEFATNASKKTAEGIKGNPNDPWSWRNRSKLKVGAGLSRYQQGLIDAGENTKAPLRRKVIGGIAGSGVFGNPDYRASRYNKMLNEVEENMSATGRDNLRFAAAGYKLSAGEQAYDGSTANHDRFFNSKGAEISGNMYSRAKRFYGFTPHGIGSSFEYTYRKAQTSEDLANARFAFARNAMENDWNGNEMVDVWAQATFPHKDKFLSEWHSTPTPADGRSGRGGVRFSDVSVNDDQLDKMVNEAHTTREQFRASSIRAQDWHAIHKRMRGIESTIDDVQGGVKTVLPAGDAVTNAATQISQGDYDANLSRYAKMSELVDSQARPGIGTMGDDGEVTVSGASAEVQNTITAISKNRRYGVTNAIDATTGDVSATNRVLYDRSAAVNKAGRALRGNELDAFVKTKGITEIKNVSPDRTPIERVS